MYHFGPLDEILHDFNVIKEAEKLGLFLNNSKSEIICVDAVVRGTIITALPGAVVVDPANAYLLGSPIRDLRSISTSLDEKTKALSIMGERFVHFSAHDSLVLLRHSFGNSKNSLPNTYYSLFPVWPS